MANHDHSSASVRIPTVAALDTWAGQAWEDGVQLERMLPLEQLVVRTANSVYEITVLSPHEATVLVRGGKFFPEFTPVRLAGSSLGGSFLKLRGIYVGFRLELTRDGDRIVTSPVRHIQQLDPERVQ